MEWRRLSIFALAGVALLCGWCSMLSGSVAWMIGYDLGQRETEAALLPEIGVLVTRVEQDSPAEEAGIARSDTILAINGVELQDVRDLHTELRRYEPDEEVQLTFRQNFTERTTTVRLGSVTREDGIEPYLGIYYTARAESPADA